MSDERRSLAVIFASVIDAHTARRTGGVVLSRPLARSLLNALNTANREHLEACAEVTRMRRQWLEAVSDKDRLDWLTREGHCLMYYGEKNGVAKWDVPDWGVRGTARGAIDLAMRDDASRVDPVPAVDKGAEPQAERLPSRSYPDVDSALTTAARHRDALREAARPIIDFLIHAEHAKGCGHEDGYAVPCSCGLTDAREAAAPLRAALRGEP